MRYSVLLCCLADFLTNVYGQTDRETFANLKLLSKPMKVISHENRREKAGPMPE